VFENYFAMKVDREGLRRDREVLQTVLATVGDSSNLVVSLEAIPAVRNATELMGTLTDLTQKQAELRALRNRYTEQYLPLQRLAADVAVLRRQTIPTMVRSLIAGIQQREQETDERIASASRDLRQIPARAIEEARLARDVSIAENLYTTLQARYEEARLTEVSSIPDVRILDAAVTPEQPLKSVTRLMLLGGLIGGLGLAVVLALVLDRFDRRIRYPEQVTRDMGLTILGVVPRVKGGKGMGGEDAAQVLEALRTVRLNLVHAYGSAGPLVVTITSPGAGDGKSFIASNLANAFADMGHRTLLIDGDTRRGMLHRVLNLQRKPGLLDHLSGRATREEIVQRAPTSSVDFIGSGTRKSGGPELLASSTMSQLVTGLRSAYSVIIVDSPPLGAGVDALMLGTLAGSIMLVLRTGVTDRELAQVKLDHLYRLPIRLLGAVLNDVRADAAYRYYYSSYYLPGYESKDEDAEPATAEVQQLGSGGQDGTAGENV
jgi:capsular exopolysaccharide synthesis family protein